MALHYIILLLLFGLTTIQSGSILPNGCPADFHIHRLLPHETDCGLFYQCSNGQRVLMHCAPGTLFSEELQVCVWPHQATCNQIAEPEPPFVPEEENTEPSETEQNTSPDHLPNGCPKDFNIHLLLPHESDCDKFYQCSNGIKYLMQCGAGTLFDNKLQVCNWPDAVECHSTTAKPTVEPITESTTHKITTEEIDEETTVKPTTEEITEQTTVDVADNPDSTTQELTTITESPDSTTDKPIVTPEPPICPVGVFGNVPHPETCDAFYLCSGGIAFEMICASGFEFDPVAQVCVTISEGGCTLGDVTLLPDDSEEATTTTTTITTTTTEDTTDVQEPICPPGEFGNVPHPDRCDAFYICSGGFSFEVFCSKGFEFNPKTQYCVEITEGGCTLGPVTTEENTSTAVTNSNSETTTKLYSEIEDVTDVETETTDAPWNQPPPISPELIPPPVENPGVNPEEPVESDKDDDDEFITDKDDDERITVEDEDSVPDVTEPICAPGVFGNIPHHSRCDAYYLCSAGMAFEVLCPSGFEFDPSTNNCAQIAEGGCTHSKNI